MSMKAMETLHDLIEEAKLRTVWWTLCIFLVSYFLTHTSKSMWMNVPIALLLVSGVHILLNEVEFRWKIRKMNPHSYLSHLQKKQLSVNDSRLSTLPPPPKWKRKIESPVVEAAIEDFINKLLQEFVVDLWYSNITPDKEAPKLIHAIIMDVLAEISTRVKDINLVDLLTRDVVDVIGDHLELFRRNHAAIGTDVMVTLSSEERDERLKHHLMDSKELHPALIAPESEYKFLKRIMGAVLAAVLRPREAQCPLVRCIARELLTCLVMEPVMRFASPGFINELIEAIFLASNNEGGKDAGDDLSSNVKAHNQNQIPATENIKTPESACMKSGPSCSQKNDNTSTPDNQKEPLLNTPGPIGDEPMYGRSGDWARVFEAATQRRTEVLQPENLDMLWTRGRNYKKKAQKNAGQGLQPPILDGSGINKKELGKEISTKKLDTSPSISKNSAQMPPRPPTDGQRKDQNLDAVQSPDPSKPPGRKELDDESSDVAHELVDENSDVSIGSKSKLKKSNSTSDLTKQSQTDTAPPNQVGGSIISEFYSADVDRQSDVSNVNVATDKVLRIEGYVPRLKCRVLGAYFENLGSKSFAVYSIAVTDSDNKTWFVKRRYRNFERLHRHLKDIPNYTLQLPPKRIFSSSTEDAFVHQRCIQLDKYIQDLLCIANIAEQHEVWDFLSISSRNYSFGRSSSVMKALAVNVDDAVDDIVRQFKGVSDGLIRKVVGPNSPRDYSSSVTNRTVSPNSVSKQNALESGNEFSDNEEGDKDGTLQHEETESTEQTNGSHSDNELNSKGIPPRVLKSDEQNKSLDLEKKNSSEVRSEILSLAANFTSTSDQQEDPLGVPAEWTPANVSVPLLNLVDKIFQLKRRGWLRRQVFWISKQILQLMMEDAIDDWLLRQIHWLRRDEIVTQGIRWIQDVLWPEGTFFLKVNTQNKTDSSQSNQGSSRNAKQGSFQEQLEAARRASDIKKMIFDGAPTTLVSLIGRKQYKRCAKDIYYFLQSAVCLKQLGYGLLELVLVTLFPELQDVILDVHGKKKSQPL